MDTQGAKENVGEKPGYIYEVTADLGSSRNISVRGNFPVGVTLESINSELDKLVRACDRQLSKAVIPNLEEDIFKHEAHLKKSEADFAASNERRQGKSIPLSEKANMENQQATIAELKLMVERKKKFLEKTKKDAE